MEETEEHDTKFEGPRCHNKKADCNHLTAVHLKGHGRCFGGEQIEEPPFWKPCECTEVVR